MPIHDWTRVDAGIFHDLHHVWIGEIRRALTPLLPPEYYSMVEQIVSDFGPDVVTLGSRRKSDSGGTTVLNPPRPKASIVATSANDRYRRKKSSVVLRHVSDDRIVSVVEVLSLGNKSSRAGFDALLAKVQTMMSEGIHVLLVDLYPPTSRDPNGIHAEIWDRVEGSLFEPPEGKPLTAVAYDFSDITTAYVEPLAVGDTLPDMPVFLDDGNYVNVPLESTYMTAFRDLPPRFRQQLET
ncbi:hypothetical protein BH11PLA2_BH11PLA2_18890 [soil metagenome]